MLSKGYVEGVDIVSSRVNHMPATEGQELLSNKPIYSILLICAFVTGLSSFIYEIVWIRMLSMVLSSSTHAFELMLSAFILGLALGGLWVRRNFDHLKNPLLVLALVQVLMGVLAITTLYTYDYCFELMSTMLALLSKTDIGYTFFNIGSHLIAVLVMLPATFLAGMTLPLITALLMNTKMAETAIGRVYALNTIGAILGVVFAVSFLMPYFGVKISLITGALLDIAVGFVILQMVLKGDMQKSIYFKLSAVAGCFGLLVAIFIPVNYLKMGSGVYLGKDFQNSEKHENIIFQQDGRTATVHLIATNNEYLSIRTNGKTDAGVRINDSVPESADLSTMVLLSGIPLLYMPEAQDVAVIGMGSGISSNVTLQSDKVLQVDTIEIEPAMVRGAQYFGDHVKDVFTDPRSNIVIDDAKTYFSYSNKKYDVIVSEPSNPWISGISGLFTTQHYSHIKNYIKEDGLYVQWVQSYQINMGLMATIFVALEKNFYDYHVYHGGLGDYVIVASPNKKLDYNLDLSAINTQLKDKFNLISINTTDDLKTHYLGSKASLTYLMNAYGRVENSDFYPVLDQHVVKQRFLENAAHDILKLRVNPVKLVHFLESNPENLNINYPISIHEQQISQYSRAQEILEYFQNNKYQNILYVGQTPFSASLGDFSAVYKNGCAGDIALLEYKWLETYKTILDGVLPLLKEDQTISIYNKLVEPVERCMNKFSDVTLHWKNLYQSLVYSDYELMFASAISVLPQEGDISDGAYRIPMTALLLSAYVLDQKQIVNQYKRRYNIQGELPAEFLLLDQLMLSSSFSPSKSF